MKVLVLSNGEFAEKEIENTLEALQKEVNGYIEIPYLSEIFYRNKIDMIINDEGKFIDGMKREIAVLRRNSSELLDIVFGNCVFTSHDDEGDTIGLNEEQIKIVKKELASGGFLDNGDFIRTLFI